MPSCRLHVIDSNAVLNTQKEDAYTIWSDNRQMKEGHTEVVGLHATRRLRSAKPFIQSNTHGEYNLTLVDSTRTPAACSLCFFYGDSAEQPHVPPQTTTRCRNPLTLHA
jgi:hypothetical protein